MNKLDWTLVFLIAAALPGCAGKLDRTEDFFEDRSTTGSLSGKAGNGSSTPAAGSGGTRWQDAGPSQSTVSAGADAPSVPEAGRTSAPPPADDDDDETDEIDAGTSNPPPKPDAGAPAAAGGAAPKPDAGMACDFRGIVQAKCGNQNCHGGPSASTGLDLTTAGLAMRMEGRKGAGSCTDRLLIDKDQPEESMLYLKVTGSSCGVKMPLGGSLSASEQACFLSWIEGL